MPAISPAPIARNMAHISRAVPGTERKRTRLNAPATATPVPTLPFTIIITTHTTAGSSASVTTKLRVQRVEYALVKGQAEARLLRRAVGLAFAAEEHRRHQRAVEVQEIAYLRAYLARARAGMLARQPAQGLVLTQGYAPLVHHLAVLLLQLDEDRAVLCRAGCGVSRCPTGWSTAAAVRPRRP